jgi:Alpha-L-arabinofuranosidase B, catalytic
MNLRAWRFVVLIACALGSWASACASSAPAGAHRGDAGAFSGDGSVEGSVGLDAECRGCDGAPGGVDTGIGGDTGLGVDTGTSDARSPSCIPIPPASFGNDGVTKPDNAAYFDGYDNIVTTSQSQTDPGSTAYTEVVGFNVPSGYSSGGVLVQFMTDQTCDTQSTSYDRTIYMDDVGHLYGGHYTGGVVAVGSPNAYNDGNSHIAALVWDGTNMTLLVDGTVVGGPVAATAPQDFSGYWCIGGGNLSLWPSSPSSDNIEATMGEVAIWQSTALTNAQMASLTTHQSDGTFDATLEALSPTFWWKLDGNSATVADSAGTNTGTFNGTVTPCGANLADSGITAATLPCDIYQIGGTPCAAAHSTVRALYGAYDGNLYQVTRASDMTTMDIPVLNPGGLADSAQQDAFCSGTTCSITIIYDQSPQGNHLPVAPPGVTNMPNGGKPANATAARITVGGHTVYGVYGVRADGTGYRIEHATGVATGDGPEAMYMVVDGTHFSEPCCFDYGNAESDGHDDGAGTMEAVYWGSDTQWTTCGGSGPWVKGDLEQGMYCGDSTDTPSNTSVTGMAYVTAMLKGPSGNHFVLKAGNAQSGGLAIKWDGARPPGYSPMKKQGAIILGTGGDGGGGDGTFFEGCMTSGNPSDAIDDAVQANIVAAGYGR